MALKESQKSLKKWTKRSGVHPLVSLAARLERSTHLLRQLVS